METSKQINKKMKNHRVPSKKKTNLVNTEPNLKVENISHNNTQVVFKITMVKPNIKSVFRRLVEVFLPTKSAEVITNIDRLEAKTISKYIHTCILESDAAYKLENPKTQPVKK